MKQQTSATTETCTKGRTVVDFSGKTIYVGIDVHRSALPQLGYLKNVSPAVKLL